MASITNLQSVIQGLIADAQNPTAQTAFAAMSGALKDLSDMYNDLSQGKTTSAQLQLTTLKDVNETLLAQQDLDSATTAKSVDWATIADDAVTLVGAGVKIALIVAPLF